MHGLALIRGAARSAGLLAWLVAGCAPAIKGTAEAGIEGSLEALTEKENQVRLAEIATSPDVQESTRALAASVTEGLIEGFQQELEAPDLEQTRKIASATAAAAVRGMTSALAQGIREDIRPALAEADLALQPAVTRWLTDEQMRQAIGGMVHEVSREAVLGSEGALDTIARQKGDSGFLEGLAGSLSMGWAALVALLSALALTFVALIVLVIKGNAQRRHLERDSRQRENMMLELMRSFTGSGSGLTPEQRARAERVGLDPDRITARRPAGGPAGVPAGET